MDRRRKREDRQPPDNWEAHYELQEVLEGERDYWQQEINDVAATVQEGGEWSPDYLAFASKKHEQMAFSLRCLEQIYRAYSKATRQ